MIWVELDGGVCYELGDDSSLLLRRGDAAPYMDALGYIHRIRFGLQEDPTQYLCG